PFRARRTLGRDTREDRQLQAFSATDRRVGGLGRGTGAAGTGAKPVEHGNRSSKPTVGSKCSAADRVAVAADSRGQRPASGARTEEHTSELQSHLNLVCRLLLEKKKQQ